jgi:uncharacterized protein (TIGR03435 family)
MASDTGWFCSEPASTELLKLHRRQTISPEDLFIKSPTRPSICAVAIAVTILTSTASHAQAPPHLEFETTSVTVHPMAPGAYMIKNFTHGPPFVIPTSNRFTDTAHTEDLIMEAFGVSGYQILYLPAWAHSRDGLVYDIDAKAKGDAIPTPEQLQLMLQSLMADRFHLKTHWETKPKFSVNALVVDKGGPKFNEFNKDDPPRGKAPTFAGTTLFALARFLTPNLDFPVVDRTGLADKLYDFDIDKLVNYRAIDRDDQTDPNEAQDYLRSAVQHQLGLRLEPRKESMQMLVIDHIDEPSKN